VESQTSRYGQKRQQYDRRNGTKQAGFAQWYVMGWSNRRNHHCRLNRDGRRYFSGFDWLRSVRTLELRDIGALPDVNLDRVAGGLQPVISLQLVAQFVCTAADTGVFRGRVVRRTSQDGNPKRVFV